jgi:hypothetical protein
METAMNRVALTAVSIVLLAGCGERVRPPLQGRLDPYESGQIHFADAELENKTAVGMPQVARGEDGGILHVTVPIRNDSRKQFSVDYRASFYDPNRQLLNQTGWFTKSLTPKVPDQVTVNSLGPQAADFQIDFRPSR